MDKTDIKKSARVDKCRHARTTVYRLERSWSGLYVCHECGRRAPVRCYLRVIEEWDIDA
jgi:hypothetical protein